MAAAAVSAADSLRFVIDNYCWFAGYFVSPVAVSAAFKSSSFIQMSDSDFLSDQLSTDDDCVDLVSGWERVDVNWFWRRPADTLDLHASSISHHLHFAHTSLPSYDVTWV